ncbi:MAG: phosphatase PAP2 family protein [Anaerolineae bacterium]
MEAILDWGVDVILWFQRGSPTLDLPFRVLTFMGVEEFFLLLLPLVYWCLDRRTGARLMIVFLFSSYLNAAAKELAGQPRPPDYAPERVRPLSTASGYGLPSGHTQNAVVVWGYIASQFRRAWLWVVAILLIVLIPLSRVYLGVHFPTDLLGGYLLGTALLLLYLWLEPEAEEWLGERGLAWKLGAALAVPLLLTLLFPTEDGAREGGALAGMGIGFVLERRWVGFEVKATWWKRALRFLVGVVVLAGLWMGLGAALSGLEPALVLRFARYGLMGLWGGLGAPWTFVQLKLARTG